MEHKGLQFAFGCGCGSDGAGMTRETGSVHFACGNCMQADGSAFNAMDRAIAIVNAGDGAFEGSACALLRSIDGG